MKKSLILVGMLAIGYTNAQTENYEGRVGINTEIPSATLNVKSKTGTTNTTKNFELENASGTKMMTVFDNGFVGVNTDTETLAERLHVKDSSIRIEGRTSLGGFLTLLNTGKEAGKQAIMPMWRIYNMGGSYGNSLQFWGYPNHTGRSAGAMQSVLVLSDIGNIGMSVSDPTQRLDVNGNARFRTLPNAVGEVTNKIVVVDDTGVLKTVDRSTISPTTATNGVQNTANMKCEEATRGAMNFVKDITIGSGTGDAFAVCLKGTDGKFYWRYLYGAGGVSNLEGNFGTGLQ